jgi:hypothetical protein
MALIPVLSTVQWEFYILYGPSLHFEIYRQSFGQPSSPNEAAVNLLVSPCHKLTTPIF